MTTEPIQVMIDDSTKLLGNHSENHITLDLLYHENSKYSPQMMGVLAPRPIKIPTFPGTPLCEGLELGSYGESSCDMSYEQVVYTRRSIRRFSAETMPIDSFAKWLRLSVGKRGSEFIDEWGTQNGIVPRTYPSGGALYPVQFYIYTQAVESISQGIYKYNPDMDTLYPVTHDVEALDKLKNAVLSGVDKFNAQCITIITADFSRIKPKYGLRAYRLGLLEAGHVMQNLCLTATALGFGSVVVNAYYDRQIEEVLHIDGVSESIVCMQLLGRPLGDEV